MNKKRTFGESDNFICLEESRPESKRMKTVAYPETENDEWTSHDFDEQDEVF